MVDYPWLHKHDRFTAVVACHDRSLITGHRRLSVKEMAGKTNFLHTQGKNQ